MAIYRNDAYVPAVWEVGDVILDQYEVKEKLGEGGFGIVYKVYNFEFNVELAVKSLKPERLLRSEDKRGFMREATNWVQLGLHPHIVTCHYVRIIGEIPRIFAEYVAGGSLHDWISERKLYKGGHEVALERILDIAIQMAWGLHYIHEYLADERGLVHQDIKPENVMITSDGVAKVTDFGLARARKLATESISVTKMGQTFAYCSPEQGLDQRPTRKTDIWSWGLSILEMFMGKRGRYMGVFAPRMLTDYLQTGSPESDASLIPIMPKALADLLHHCFQQEPANRPATMNEVAHRLIEIFEKEIGKPYERRQQDPIKLADNFNNRAVSLIELDKVEKVEKLWEKAEKLWEEALKITPQHIEATFNLEVSRWRRGQLDDVTLLPRLEDLCDSFHDYWLPKYLLALIYLEQADVDSAIELLELAIRQVPSHLDLQPLLNSARSGNYPNAYCLGTFQQFDEVTSVAFSSDGGFCFSGSPDGRVKIWNIYNKELLQYIRRGIKPVKPIAISPDGHFVLSGSSDGTLKIREKESGRCLRTLTGHISRVTSVAISPDGQFALSESSDGTVKVWSLPSKVSKEYVWRPARLWSYTEWLTVRNKIEKPWRLAKENLSQKRWPLALKSLHDTQQQLYPYQTNWLIRAWQQLYPFTRKIGLRAAWLERTLQGHTDKITSVAFSPDGHLCLSGARDQTVKVWKVETGDCLHTLEGHENRVWSVAISPDGQFALSGSLDKTLKLWDIKKGRYLRTFSGHTSGVISVAFSASGRFCFSGSDDRSLKVWDVGTGYCLRTLQGHSNAVTSVTCSADDWYCLSGSDDGVLKVWEIKTGDCLQTLAGHTNSIKSAAFSPDGRYCCSGGRDKTLKVWDLKADNADNCLHTLTGHKSELRSVAISPDGHFVLSGSSDGTIKVWDIKSGDCLRTLKGHTDWVLSVAFSPDGRYALSGSWDDTLKVWALDWVLKAREEANWDEGVRAYLENFLTRQTPYMGTLPQEREPTKEEIQWALTPCPWGGPIWTLDTFARLMRELQGAGYGSVYVNTELEKMARKRG